MKFSLDFSFLLMRDYKWFFKSPDSFVVSGLRMAVAFSIISEVEKAEPKQKVSVLPSY